ncbi:BatD family protein [Myroides guanonis]|uniref:Oxygen tolerance n=1 Tax=Myroides guanonis TaxID=1150112 RepID=A0A1I3RJI5_9FLAO|nr:BatD family protein [Myroides guanonis]SFJ46002.1 hypothetical protein SAMN04487893_10835 [Myroides guanonis]
MMIDTMRKHFIHILFSIFLISNIATAQNPLETTVDTTSIKIGDTFLLTLKAKVQKGSTIQFPESDKLGDFEVIESSAIDTILSETNQELIKKYSLTQFDSGSYRLPQLPVIIDNKIFKTQGIDISVLNVAVDTLKQPMYEIKSVAKDSSSNYDWIYILISVLVIIIGIVLYYYIKKRQESNLSEDDYYKSPYEKAIKKLKKLEEKKNWTRGDAKPYYSDMTFIARSFIEDTFNISAHELTTQEIVAILRQTLANKKVKINKSVIEEFRKVLQTADLVKFAKSQPQEFEITADTSKIEKIIDSINTAYPISIESQSEKIRLREERKKKRIRFRRLVPISITGFLLLIIGTIYFLTNIQDNTLFKSFSFNSTKRLLNREWITSTYGSPGITVSTPKVLSRYNDPTVQQTLPTGVTNVQQFLTGDINDPLHVLLNNITMEKEDTFDKKLIISHSINIITQQFKASNVKFDESDFENSNGISGTKVTGSYTIIHPATNKEAQITFEIVFLINGTNVDEVCVFYSENDAIGPEVAQKVFESIIYKSEE